MAFKSAEHSELRLLQMSELELMKIFVEICQKHNLRYYMIGGTMLGAVRHKGFIPWDDDMDVGMPRPDYIKFLKIVSDELPEGCELNEYSVTEGYTRGFAKIINTKVVVTNASYTQEAKQFVWLDIFPLDGMASNKILRMAHFGYLTALRFFFHASCYNTILNLYRPSRPLFQRMMIKFIKITKIGTKMDSKKILACMDKSLLRHDYDASDYVVSMYGAYLQKELMPKAYFGQGAMYDYEDSRFIGPQLYDEFLTCLYGDYMTPPREDDRHEHNIVKVERLD